VWLVAPAMLPSGDTGEGLRGFVVLFLTGGIAALGSGLVVRRKV
jgi:hypothetical protein